MEKSHETYFKAYKKMEFKNQEEEGIWMEKAMKELTESMIDVPVRSLQYRMYRSDLQNLERELVKMSNKYVYQAPMGNVGSN